MAADRPLVKALIVAAVGVAMVAMAVYSGTSRSEVAAHVKVGTGGGGGNGVNAVVMLQCPPASAVALPALMAHLPLPDHRLALADAAAVPVKLLKQHPPAGTLLPVGNHSVKLTPIAGTGKPCAFTVSVVAPSRADGPVHVAGQWVQMPQPDHGNLAEIPSTAHGFNPSVVRLNGRLILYQRLSTYSLCGVSPRVKLNWISMCDMPVLNASTVASVTALARARARSDRRSHTSLSSKPKPQALAPASRTKSMRTKRAGRHVGGTRAKGEGERQAQALAGWACKTQPVAHKAQGMPGWKQCWRSSGVADLRLFTANNELYGIGSFKNVQCREHPMLVRYNASSLLPTSHSPIIYSNTWGGRQKNWIVVPYAPRTLNHAPNATGPLVDVISRREPLAVVQVDLATGHVLKMEGFAANKRLFDGVKYDIRGSSNYVPLFVHPGLDPRGAPPSNVSGAASSRTSSRTKSTADAHADTERAPFLLTIIHARVNRKFYAHMFVATKSEYPYESVARSHWFYVRKDGLEVLHDRSLKKTASRRVIQFVAGLDYADDSRETLLVTFGVDDCHGAGMLLRVKDIVSTLVVQDLSVLDQSPPPHLDRR